MPEEEGIWLIVPIGNGCLLRVEEDGSFRSSIWDPTTLEKAMKQGIGIVNLCRHLKLFERIKMSNT